MDYDHETFVNNRFQEVNLNQNFIVQALGFPAFLFWIRVRNTDPKSADFFEKKLVMPNRSLKIGTNYESTSRREV